MDAGGRSLSSVLQDLALRITAEWLVRILLLVSMLLQLALVVLGTRRYYISNAIFRFVVWGAYISADAVAISALATMMHSARNEIYGLWAPVLLLHLGGPDAITAYSMADNELWLRHGFDMIYQVSVAVYVIYSSALERYSLSSAILLLIVGFIKYGERTHALWLGTYSQIVTSCLPISKYMKGGNVSMEEKQVHREGSEGSSISIEGNVVRRRGYVVMGEKQLERMIDKEEGRDIEAGTRLEGRGIVTIDAVKSAHIEGMDYNLCLSHALFKMYKRRIVNLSFGEWQWPETIAFWEKLGGDKAFRVIEMELKFMYDALFSKFSRTAFGKWGVLIRLLNATLMGVAGFFILKEEEYREAQRAVTYVVISVALVVEVFQLCRIMTSDWTRVRLICATVDDLKHPLPEGVLKWSRDLGMIVIKKVVIVLDMIHNLLGGRASNRSRGSVHQHCLIETCYNGSRLVWKLARFLPNYSFAVTGYIKLRHVHKVSVQDDLKCFIFAILKEKLSKDGDRGNTMGNIYRKILEKIREFTDQWYNLEEIVLMLHLATTMCEEEKEENVSDNVRFSRVLSRYCAYLLLSRPSLLPLHPDMAKIAYLDLVQQILKMPKSTMESLMGKHSTSEAIEPASLEARCPLGAAYKIVGILKEKGKEERWKLLSEYWGQLVIYMASYNKARVHVECLAGGGEFLSQVWVLLGHMGFGEQSDSAVTLKVEATLEQQVKEMMERERVEREKKERERKEVERKEQERKELEQERIKLQKEVEQERIKLQEELQQKDQERREQMSRELEQKERELKKLSEKELRVTQDLFRSQFTEDQINAARHMALLEAQAKAQLSYQQQYGYPQPYGYPPQINTTGCQSLDTSLDMPNASSAHGGQQYPPQQSAGFGYDMRAVANNIVKIISLVNKFRFLFYVFAPLTGYCCFLKDSNVYIFL